MTLKDDQVRLNEQMRDLAKKFAAPLEDVAARIIAALRVGPKEKP
jgi:hypothetical protein